MRHRLPANFLLAGLFLGAFRAPAQSDLERGWQFFYRGEYASAAEAFERTAAAPASRLAALVGQSSALEEMGEYERSRAVVATEYSKTPSADLANRLGEIALRIGEQVEALQYFNEAIRIDAGFRPAQLNWAILQWHRGERIAARRTLLGFLDFYQTAKQLTAADLAMVARACIYLERYKDANRLFQDAVKQAPDNWTLYISWGDLFLEKYNVAEARGIYQEAIKKNPSAVPALCGLARCLAAENMREAIAVAQRAVTLNPHSPHVRTTLAELYLAVNDEKAADAELEKISGRFPNYLPALALRAILADRRNDAATVERLCQKAAQINPKSPDIYIRLGEDAARRYLFRESVAYFRKALELDPDNWNAAAELGTSLSRLGEEKEAKAQLERAFERDPYNVLAGNLLNLFDDYAKYDTIRTPHFLLRLHRDDKPIIGATAAVLCEAAYKSMASRYNATLPNPILVEIFPKHDDFAVRCFGLPGAQVFLGICFGRLIAMDSPRARQAGDFNWQETLWHEIAHVFHLELTANRIPRWLAEGIAVYEATNARREWDMNMELVMIRALRNGQLLPLRDLDEGFTRRLELVSLAYYQASQIIMFIERRHGFNKVLALFPHFRQGKKTEEAITAVFGQSVDEFDKTFQDFLRDRFHPSRVKVEWPYAQTEAVHGPPREIEALRQAAAAEPQNFFANLYYGRRLAEIGNPTEAEVYLKKAKALLPEYVDAQNPYLLLADLYWKQNRRREAVAELEYLTSKNGKNFQEAVRLSEWQLALGDTTAAMRALERALNIFPYKIELQNQYGRLLLALRQPKAAVQVFRTVLAMNPVDRAEVYCWLAQAYLSWGQKLQAKKNALLALEIAPNFERAQEILLQAVE
ncbi:MAG: tetratricopeptide repeat protein [candidate division KSB1 bacterium]|nr:tetratricopeptide repeat protein [candidate division KSB1 bacterium]MDZ7364444.1 tetratricopeptide repeat protein [candidate division KSB1 bacterium]MDZ7402816.1 tetratricopeptide repeat protein [candidate division KSB1 bacterium]